MKTVDTQFHAHIDLKAKEKAQGLTMSSLSLCVAVACNGALLTANPAYANGPKGGVIVDGSGDISKVDRTTIITQTSQNMAINEKR